MESGGGGVPEYLARLILGWSMSSSMAGLDEIGRKE